MSATYNTLADVLLPERHPQRHEPLEAAVARAGAVDLVEETPRALHAEVFGEGGLALPGFC